MTRSGMKATRGRTVRDRWRGSHEALHPDPRLNTSNSAELFHKTRQQGTVK